MPRAAPKKQTLAALSGDMSDDDELAYTQFGTDAPEMPTPDSAAENKAAIATKKRATNRPKAAPKAKTQSKPVASSVKEPATKKTGKRSALEDLTNVDANADQAPVKKRAKTAQKAAVKPAKQATPEVEAMVVEESIEIPPPIEDISQSIEQASPPQVVAGRHTQAPVRSQSQNRPIARANSRAHSIEQNVGDAALRRRLGNLTSKYEILELKYSQLKEVASVEGQSSFDKLKVSTDKHSKTQDNLIASLRKQLAMQTDLANEVRRLRTQVDTTQSENDKLKQVKEASVAEIKTLKESNTKTQNEVKALQAKLTASRANADSAQAKGKAAPTASNTSSALASLKEDLYCDVTGLLIHNVKKTDRRTVYDCSQTGRNGTLRFQFTIDEIDVSTMTPGASVFDDAQVTYTPLIDERNDQQLYDILADYLLEEIEFPRSSLMKLYTSIRDGMTKAVVLQEEDDDSSRDED